MFEQLFVNCHISFLTLQPNLPYQWSVFMLEQLFINHHIPFFTLQPNLPYQWSVFEQLYIDHLNSFLTLNPNLSCGVTISLQIGGQGHPTPMHTPTPTPHTNIQKVSKTLVFPLFDSIITNRPTEQQTNGPTDGQSLF